MKTREQIRNELIELNLVVENSYLDLYVDLIVNNYETKKQKSITLRHHIIPRYYYRVNGLLIDNSIANIVNVSYSDHILCHYYLSLCSSTPTYFVKNSCSINMLMRFIKEGKNDFDITQLNDYLSYYELYSKNMQLYNCMFDSNIKDKHDLKMRDKSTRDKISKTLKDKINSGLIDRYEQRSHLGNGTRGMVYVHKDGVNTAVQKENLQCMIDSGWEIGSCQKLSPEHKLALINSHLGKKYSLEHRDKLSASHIGKIPYNKGVPLSDDAKRKLSLSIQGRKWINNGYIQKLVKEEDVAMYLLMGFVMGRLSKNKNRK